MQARNPPPGFAPTLPWSKPIKFWSGRWPLDFQPVEPAPTPSLGSSLGLAARAPVWAQLGVPPPTEVRSPLTAAAVVAASSGSSAAPARAAVAAVPTLVQRWIPPSSLVAYQRDTNSMGNQITFVIQGQGKSAYPSAIIKGWVAETAEEQAWADDHFVKTGLHPLGQEASAAMILARQQVLANAGLAQLPSQPDQHAPIVIDLMSPLGVKYDAEEADDEKGIKGFDDDYDDGDAGMVHGDAFSSTGPTSVHAAPSLTWEDRVVPTHAALSSVVLAAASRGGSPTRRVLPVVPTVVAPGVAHQPLDTSGSARGRCRGGRSGRGVNGAVEEDIDDDDEELTGAHALSPAKV